MNTEPNGREKDCDNNANSGLSNEAGQRNASSEEEHKFQSKWLTLWPWLTFNKDAIPSAHLMNSMAHILFGNGP